MAKTPAGKSSADAICAAMNTRCGPAPGDGHRHLHDVRFHQPACGTRTAYAADPELTPKLATARSLALVWGEHSAQAPDVSTVREMVDRACQCAVAKGFCKPGDAILISAGMPFGTPGTTNLLRIAAV